MQNPASKGGVRKASSSAGDLVFLRLQDLLAAVHARFQVDVVRTAKFARAVVFDIGVHVEPVVGAAHARARFRLFTLGDGHGTVPESGLAAHPYGTRERAPVNAARRRWQASNGRIFKPGPSNENGRPEGRPRDAKKKPGPFPAK